MPARPGEAFLTQAIAPWSCSTYLRVRVADAELSMAVDYAAPVISALFMLTTAGQTDEEVTR